MLDIRREAMQPRGGVALIPLRAQKRDIQCLYALASHSGMAMLGSTMMNEFTIVQAVPKMDECLHVACLPRTSKIHLTSGSDLPHCPTRSLFRFTSRPATNFVYCAQSR